MENAFVEIEVTAAEQDALISWMRPEHGPITVPVRPGYHGPRKVSMPAKMAQLLTRARSLNVPISAVSPGKDDGRLLVRPVSPQPPERFSTGDCAAITNGTSWAFSRIPVPGGKGEAWPPGDEPGILPPIEVTGHKTRIDRGDDGIWYWIVDTGVLVDA